MITAKDFILKERKGESSNENPPVLILLHGYGSNELDLFSFTEELPKETHIISLRAPRTLGAGSYAWYSLHFDNINGKFSDIPEAEESRAALVEFIKETKQKFQTNNIILLGFSQGAILSMSIALSHPNLIQNVIALSGYIDGELLPENPENLDYSKSDFFVSHGSVDQVIPVTLAKQTPIILDKLGIKNCFKEYQVGHGVAPQNFWDFKNWLETKI